MGQQQQAGWVGPTVFLLGVLTGTGSTLTMKIIYSLEAVGVSGELQKFEKPLTATWVMFVGMSLAMPAYWLQTHFQRKNNKSALDFQVDWLTYFKLLIPSCFDLLGTALSGIGLLFTTVSVYQLMRCSVIIVTALLKRFVLGHKLENYMWFGIFINTVAMALVSSTSFADPGMDAANGMVRDPRIGLMFILLSCIVQGSQYVFEEKVMAVDAAPPLVVVGMEGVWGMLLMPAVVFPWAYILPGTDVGGCIENIFDSYVMLVNSRAIQWVLISFTVTIFFYNICCIYVTALSSSIWHAILDNFRPVAVWGADLMLFYVFTAHKWGEEWTMFSWLEFAGMLLLFFGTAVYNGTVKLDSLFDYPEVPADLDEQGRPPPHGTPRLRTSQAMSSPSLTSSPLLTHSIQRAKAVAHTEIAALNLHQQSSYGSATSSYHGPSSRKTIQTSAFDSNTRV